MSGSEEEEEEYSSSEDEDYVPSGAEYSEDDVSELVQEEPLESPRPPRGRSGPRRPGSRKRKKGGLLLEPDEKEEEKAQQNEEEKGEEEEEVDNVEQVERKREEEEKKKEDALWARFLSDVGEKPKAGAATQAKKAEEEKSGNKLQEKPKESEKPKDAGKVTITKVFDFAGEEVRVTKEVDSTSKEAKSFLKQQEKWQQAAPASLPTGSGQLSSHPTPSLEHSWGCCDPGLGFIKPHRTDPNPSIQLVDNAQQSALSQESLKVVQQWLAKHPTPCPCSRHLHLTVQQQLLH
ncbi:craniofacial development protein 1 isoform X2 [Pogoniulus pusillus]|uniref:craniofacial development protein 1 isoform X2 n=1 Tax=Pogoniulus pusillus TaxID=488313 RepID=UPI0030B957E2